MFAVDVDATYDELKAALAKMVDPLERTRGVAVVTIEDLEGEPFTMSKFLLVAAMAMATIAMAPRALACVCVESGSTADQLDAAETVVLGRVVGLAIRTKQVDGETVEYMAATIRVERRWKGSKKKQVTVNTCGDQVLVCTCGVRFELGGTYIVVTEQGAQVSSCGLTRAAFPSEDPLVAEIDAHFRE